MNNLEFDDIAIGRNMKEELIIEQPVWDVRCWLEALNQGEYTKVVMNEEEYTDANALFREVLSQGEYKYSIEDKDKLTIVYKDEKEYMLRGIKKYMEFEKLEELFDIFSKEDVLKYCVNNNINPELW